MLLITDYGSHGKLSAGPVQALCAKNIRGGRKRLRLSPSTPAALLPFFNMMKSTTL